MSPFAREILADIKSNFGGAATLPELKEWFGASDAVMRDALRELLNDRKLWQVQGSLTTSKPLFFRARLLLRRGATLETAAAFLGMTPRELDLAMWRDMCGRAEAAQRANARSAA